MREFMSEREREREGETKSLRERETETHHSGLQTTAASNSVVG